MCWARESKREVHCNAVARANKLRPQLLHSGDCGVRKSLATSLKFFLLIKVLTNKLFPTTNTESWLMIVEKNKYFNYSFGVSLNGRNLFVEHFNAFGKWFCHFSYVEWFFTNWDSKCLCVCSLISPYNSCVCECVHIFSKSKISHISSSPPLSHKICGAKWWWRKKIQNNLALLNGRRCRVCFSIYTTIFFLSHFSLIIFLLESVHGEE